ncbi:hypothetical protein BLA29_004938 [Euroglyphus maynei]|uniref:Uncharacterized protein n=1 Tax=Euroglyphus maynei TaxID=6958 RepID=A0A1Y3BQM7_EURMA|nr:hypothetical protein BLA29_004938 [Euroglyphus maynei]
MNRANFINYLYLPTLEVLRPSCRVKDIIFWNEIYVPVSNNGTDVTNMAISSCNGICNGTASTTVVSVNPNNDHQQFDCNHETKCQSQSKCDLNRSASYESLANFDLKQPSKTSANCNNVPSLKHFDQYINRISATTITPVSSPSSVMTRHLSDTCLFKRSNQIVNNNMVIATPYMTNGFFIGDNFKNINNNGDMDEMVRQPSSLMNGLTNKHPNMMVRFDYNHGVDIEDCHLISTSNHDQSSYNKLIYTNCNGFNNVEHPSKMINNSSNSTDSLATIFDIDGQIIGHNNNSRLQLHQLINYHKNMIKRLTNQLNFKK